MKLFKYSLLLFVFIFTIFLSSSSIVNAEGYCTVDYTVPDTEPFHQENEHCTNRHTDIECDQDPYYHLNKATWCQWIGDNNGGGGEGMDINVTANPAYIYPGQNSTITWSSVGADSCDTGVLGSTATGGSISVSPTEHTSYPIVCTGSNGSISGEATVLVAAVSLSKDQTRIKNIVKKNDSNTSGIGTAYLTVTAWDFPTGDSCVLKNSGTTAFKVLPSGATEALLPFSSFVFNQNIDVLNQNDTNLFQLKCGPDISNPIFSSSTENVQGQSGTLVPAGSSSCIIPANGNSCQISMNWTTTSPKDNYNTFVWNGNNSTVGTSGNSSLVTLSGIGVIPLGATSGTGTLISKNRVDGQNNTLNNPTYASNDLASQTITLNCATGSSWDGAKCTATVADLIASAPNPTTAVPGVYKTFSAVITNQGQGSTERSFANKFQTSTLPNGEGTITDYAVSPNMDILLGGESNATSKSIKFNTAGEYGMRVCADLPPVSPGTIDNESDEGNNCSSWTTITVASGSLPDLIASTPTPTTASPGTTTFYSTITNQGNASTLSTFTNVFQTATSIGDNGPEGVVNYVTSSTSILASGASTTTQRSINFSAGAYYMRVCADKNMSMNGSEPESNEGNNCSSPWIMITVTSPVGPPDLVASAPSPTMALPNIAKTYSSTITNQGGGSTGSGFSNLFQTATGFDGDNNPLGLINYPVNVSPLMSALGPGSSTPTSKSITFNTAGTYYMRVCADLPPDNPGTITNEYNENNNCSPWTAITVALFGGQPDLIASTPIPTVAQTGVSTTFYSTITNRGIASTGGSFANKFQTRNSIGVVVDYPVLGAPMSPLGPGATAVTSRAITFSLAGTYDIQACADMPPNNPGTITIESNEGNNCSGWTSITVGGSLPDLITSSITPTTALVGVDTPFSVTISNIGTAGTVIGFKNLVQMTNSPSGFNAPDDVGVIATIALASGETRVLTKNYKFTQAGIYYMRVCADKDSASNYGVVGESSESNNCGEWTMITVPGTMSGPDLIASSPTPTTVSPGVSTLFSSTITNQGNASTVNKFTNLFQLSTLPNGNGIVTDYPVIPEMNALAQGASATTSRAFTFNVGTYYMRVCADKSSQIDTGDIPESNELNNCSGEWTTITVSNDMSGTLLPFNPTCFIPLNGTSCTQTLTWTTINPIGTSAVTSPTGIPSPVNGNNGSQSFTVPHNDLGVNFFLYNSEILLAQTNVTTACVLGTDWDGAKCAVIPIDGGWSICGAGDWSACSVPCGGGTQTCIRTCTNPVPQNGGADCPPPAEMTQICNTQACSGGGGAVTVDLSATKPIIFKGKSSDLVWTSTGATSCTGDVFETGGATSGSTTVFPLTTTTYTITCTDGGSLAQAQDTQKITVINPIIIEN
ncbi:MAG: CARDB domain-containing protein [Candidatus Paceibacterota bacterium]|jgi:hypothetical protein